MQKINKIQKLLRMERCRDGVGRYAGASEEDAACKVSTAK